MTLPLAPMDLQALVADAGLTGWKASIHRHPEANGYIAVLTPPGYDPTTQGGPRLVTARGEDHAGALAKAVETAQAQRRTQAA